MQKLRITNAAYAICFKKPNGMLVNSVWHATCYVRTCLRREISARYKTHTLRKTVDMLGWMILFAVMALLGTVSTLAHPAAVSALVGFTFGSLFFIGLLTRLVRGRGW